MLTRRPSSAALSAPTGCSRPSSCALHALMSSSWTIRCVSPGETGCAALCCAALCCAALNVWAAACGWLLACSLAGCAGCASGHVGLLPTWSTCCLPQWPQWPHVQPQFVLICPCCACDWMLGAAGRAAGVPQGGPLSSPQGGAEGSLPGGAGRALAARPPMIPSAQMNTVD